jgi:nicotinamide-nucleotide amidase
VRVELLTVGDELLLGFTIDTNAAHLARELSAAGVEIARRATVGDTATDIADAVREALDRTGAVITTGGLGPTSDDRTKPAIAALFDREMTVDESIWEAFQKLWKARGYPGDAPLVNRQQALIPEGATILRNNHGTAPGIWLEDDRGRWVAMLPGVPREMRGMLADELLPRLRRLGAGESVVRSRTLRTTGLAESKAAELLAEHGSGFGDIPLAYIPNADGLDLRLTSTGKRSEIADGELAEGIRLMRERLAHHVYGEDRDDLAAVVLTELRARKLRVAVAESCTGGLLGARITAVPGSSDVMLGGVIAYDNAIKEKLLGVRPETLKTHGAVSEETVREMATGARAHVGADVGISITGIAGPSGGSAAKPVGTVWVATDIQGRITAHHRQLGGDRQEIRHRAAQMALHATLLALRT